MTDKVEQVTSKGIVSGGVEREFDVIVYATGFRTTNYLSSIKVTGRGGLKLQDAWSDGGRVLAPHDLLHARGTPADSPVWEQWSSLTI